LERYPDARNRPVALEVVFKFKPDRDGEAFLIKARQVIESAGFQFRHKIFTDSYDNYSLSAPLPRLACGDVSGPRRQVGRP
jgi:hypothetical protein